MFLFIADPPSPPQIHGDLRAEQKSGDRVKLTCLTEGGNPLPTLTWLRNDIPLRERTLLEKGAYFYRVGQKRVTIIFCRTSSSFIAGSGLTHLNFFVACLPRCYSVSRYFALFYDRAPHIVLGSPHHFFATLLRHFLSPEKKRFSFDVIRL